MQHDFTNRLDLLTPFLAFSIWAAHFTLLWSVSSVFPEQSLARWLAAVLTAVAFAALYGITRWRSIRTLVSIPGLGLALSTVAVAFTALPALIG
jgi:hypothetical protein